MSCFECKCGGDSFGTVDSSVESNKWVHFCHSCFFEWPSADDHLYMHDYEADIATLRELIVELEQNRARSADLSFQMVGRPLPVITKLLYEHSALVRRRLEILDEAGVTKMLEEVNHA